MSLNKQNLIRPSGDHFSDYEGLAGSKLFFYSFGRGPSILSSLLGFSC